MPWVRDVHSGGNKIPERLKEPTRRRILAHAEKNFAGRSRFDLASNAAHALALAALRFPGYRSENRYVVFQSLAHTLNLPAEQWRVLDQAHKKRNLAEYEGDVDLDLALVEALIRVAG